MMNAVMLVKNRPRLTKQALDSFAENTSGDWNLTIVDDQSNAETRAILRSFALLYRSKVALLRNDTSSGITGQVRNLGVYWSEKFFGRGDWLYLSDNDVAFLPQWDWKLTMVYGGLESSRTDDLFHVGAICVLGGSRHPYHQPNGQLVPSRSPYSNVIHASLGTVDCVDAVAGYSQLMRWRVWDRFGPLDAHAPGICQSEDFAFCQRIVKAGGNVGYINPSVVVDCGITTWDGKPAVGAEAKTERIPGIIYE